MPFLEQIVTDINIAILSKLQSDTISISVHGISKQLPRTDDNTEIPAYVDYTGEGSFNAIDDRFALCIYHKCTGLVFSNEEGSEFGDAQDFSRETSNMSIFVWGDRRKLKMTQETVLAIISSALPSEMSKTFTDNFKGLGSATIAAASSPNDSLQAWANEFRGIVYPLPPEQFFLQLNYIIETVIQKSCIEVCTEC